MASKKVTAETDQQIASSILALLEGKSNEFARRPALGIKRGSKWEEVSYGELRRRARSLAAYLIEFGLVPGDRVAILSESTPDWGVACFAAILAGGIVVPLDVKLGEAELTTVVTDCAPHVVFASARHKERARSVKAHVPSIRLLAVLDRGQGDEGISSIDHMVPQTVVPSCERRPDEVALIVYTSGTTGSPKGVMITFENLIFQVRALERLLEIQAPDRSLSILPLNHLLELTGGFLGVLHKGGTICYSSGVYPQDLLPLMREHKITLMIGVPLFFKVLKNGIEREVGHKSPGWRLAYAVATHVASFLPWRTIRRALFFPLHHLFGGKVRAFVSGGAPLDQDVAEFFDRAGFPILQGYGLTETSPVISVNTFAHNRLGSVGKPLPGVEVRIDADRDGEAEGEILTRGPHVMKGYYGDPELTREVIDESGWLHTGDLGRMDRDGFLYVTGRLKNVIVLGGGKKVSAEEVEAALRRGTAIEEVCVFSQTSTHGITAGTEEVCAVVVPSATLMRQHGGCTDLVEQAVREEFDRLVMDLAPYKRPTRIFVFPDPLPKTATEKVKRQFLLHWLENRGV